MLTGRFGDTSGRPYIEGRLIFPALKISGDISFLIDTGADRSLLHPDDGIRLGIDYANLTGNAESVGIGGICQNFVEPAWFVFSEPKRFLYIHFVDLAISPPAPERMQLPSLLGRDILDKWRMIYNPIKKRLTFQVLSADVTVPIPP
jgi:hypothetical protein